METKTKKQIILEAIFTSSVLIGFAFVGFAMHGMFDNATAQVECNQFVVDHFYGGLNQSQPSALPFPDVYQFKNVTIKPTFDGVNNNE